MDSIVTNNKDSFLEESLRQGKRNADNLILVYEKVKAIGDEANRNNKETKQQIKDFQKKLDRTNKLANKAIDISRVDHNQDRKVVKAVYAKSNVLAKEWITEHHSAGYGGSDYLMKKIGQVRSAIYHELKDRYNVNVRSDLKMVDFDNCLAWADSLTLASIDSWRVADRQTTLDTLNKWEQAHGLPLTKLEE